MKPRFPLMDDQPGASGGGAPAAPAVAAPAAPAGDAPAVPAAPAAPASALAAGAAAPAPAAPAPAPGDWLPEKLRVFGEDGKTLDLEASAKKVAEAYSHAEKRIGTGDVPPKTVDDYKINVPEAMADKFKAEDMVKDPMVKDFLTKAHASGMTQAQVDLAVGEFMARAGGLAEGVKTLDMNECVAALKEVWKDDATYNTEVQAAYRAASAYGDVEALMAKYGNDPDFIQFAAKVGKEVGPAGNTPSAAQGVTEMDVEALQKTEAYWKPTHPDHEATKRKVAAFYEQKFGTAPKRGASVPYLASN